MSIISVEDVAGVAGALVAAITRHGAPNRFTVAELRAQSAKMPEPLVAGLVGSQAGQSLTLRIREVFSRVESVAYEPASATGKESTLGGRRVSSEGRAACFVVTGDA